jgi:hypothetical protein
VVGQLYAADRKRIEAVAVAARVRLAAKDPNIDNIITDADKVLAFYNNKEQRQ